MYHHVKKLMYTVRVDQPDAVFGNMLLEQFGGANGELAAAMGVGLRTGDAVISAGTSGTAFAVWAPNAASVAVMGDWNGWSPDKTPLSPCGSSGIWDGFAQGAARGIVPAHSIELGAHRDRRWRGACGDDPGLIEAREVHDPTQLREAALASGYVTAEQFDKWVRPERMVG